MKGQCKHRHGDNINPLGWVCGQCFNILEERPKTYGMVSGTLGVDGEYKTHPIQQIVWMAEIKVSEQKTTLSDFVSAIARRYQVKGLLGEHESYLMALESMKNNEEEFGDEKSDWSRVSAIDIADEEMSYWENDGDPSDNH
jgi:hypothetical protein